MLENGAQTIRTHARYLQLANGFRRSPVELHPLTLDLKSTKDLLWLWSRS